MLKLRETADCLRIQVAAAAAVHQRQSNGTIIYPPVTAVERSSASAVSLCAVTG
jgi:hypothetical protein